MIKQGFSKIWLAVILAVLAIGGILVWKLLVVPKEKEPGVKIPEEEIKINIKIDKELVKKTIAGFMNYRLKGDSQLFSYLPDDAEIVYLRYTTVLTSFSNIVLSTPDLKRYEILQGEETNPGKLQFVVNSYIEKEDKDAGYYNEKINMEKVGGNYLISSFKQGDYNPINEDPCQGLEGETKDACYYNLAEATKDVQLCEKISPEWGIALVGSGRNECYTVLGVLLSDLSLCEKGGTRKQWCYRSIAVKEKNEKLCEKLKDEEKSLCYYYLALKKNDPSLCDLAENFPGTPGQELCQQPPMRGEPARYYRSTCKKYFTETQGKPFIGINGRDFIRLTLIEPNQEISVPIVEPWKGTSPVLHLFNGWSFYLDKTNLPIPTDPTTKPVAFSLMDEAGQKLYEGLVIVPNQAFCFEMWINPEYLKVPDSKKGVIKIFDGVKLEIPVTFR